jgi:hypothetical protein
MASIFRPLFVTINNMIDGYLFQLPSTVPVTSNYTVSRSDSFIPVNATSGSVTITLPAAKETKGKRYTVKKVDSSTNSVIVDPTGSDTIDDATTATLNIQYESICIMSDGSEYWII